MDSKALTRSPLWTRYSTAIAREFRAGVPFPDILEMNCAIKQRDLAPYEAHRRRLDELLWYDDPEPKTIIDLGAGYGAMAGFWPEGSRVFNVDLPEMLEIQASYILNDLGPLPKTDDDRLTTFEFVPFTEADRLPFDGAYLFSVWALTETTMDTWRYYIDKAPRLAGAYVLGFQRWVDETEPWPWRRLGRAFKTVRAWTHDDATRYELAAVNR